MVKFEVSITRRHLYALVGLIAVVAMAIPAAGWAADRFKDVPDTNVFHNDITWLADAGVTLGCNPPANDEFCPGDVVKRETMAAFMKRLAVNKVVDAATAVTAEDSDTLDGFDSSELVRVYGAKRTNTLSGVTTNTNLASLNAEAPVAGVFLITAVADLEHDCAAAGEGVRGATALKVDGITVVSTQEARDECVSPYDMTYAATGVATAAVEVPAGAHTILFDWSATSGTLWSGGASISVVFTPFGSGLAITGSTGPATQNPSTP